MRPLCGQDIESRTECHMETMGQKRTEIVSSGISITGTFRSLGD